MTASPEAVTRRAERLVHWYPRVWRDRYGEEFAELLIAEISERPRSWRRTADVIRNGLLARLACAGLAEHGIELPDRVRVRLVALGCASATFLACGLTMWAQLIIGWRWSRPDTDITTTAIVVMSGAMLLFLALAVLAAVPIAWALLLRVARLRARALLSPALLFASGTLALIVGGRHFGRSWPGTGGRPWAYHDLVPSDVASFTWASTRGITAYWAHPRALQAFSTAEIAWMAVSPIAMVCIVVGAAKTVRRLELSPRVLRYETGIGNIAVFGMAVFLTMACGWVLTRGYGPRGLFHAGAVDVAGLIVMAAALFTAHHARRSI
ncbi:hypothetical protein GCM10029978_028200 [Actinoallomurus acanthiterrae]